MSTRKKAPAKKPPIKEVTPAAKPEIHHLSFVCCQNSVNAMFQFTKSQQVTLQETEALLLSIRELEAYCKAVLPEHYENAETVQS